MKNKCINLSLHARIQKVWQRDPTLTFVLVDEGREDPNTTISGSSSARQRNAIVDGPTLNAGSFVLFRGFGLVLFRNPIFL